MAQRAGKSKPFTSRQAIGLAVFIACLQSLPSEAAWSVDFPAFRSAEKWMEAPLLLRLTPRPDFMPADRTAVETLLLEAAGDGFSSMVAVGEAIRNRMELFHQTAPEICLQPRQFSGWNDRARAAKFLKEHRACYGRAWLAWKLSAATRLTQGATDYHEQTIHPYWAGAYTRTAQVGSHIFYIRQARRIRAESGPVPA